MAMTQCDALKLVYEAGLDLKNNIQSMHTFKVHGKEIREQWQREFKDMADKYVC